jgi:hypothetical protein
VTKQFLSESTSWADNLIFALAPVGIITAVVSAIRVCGGPSAKAFIGRAQEPLGEAEIELLSSTSDSTGEVWTDGGIARVFGTPAIIEIVKNQAVKEHYDSPEAGIEVLANSPDWIMVGNSRVNFQHEREGSVRSPNLSLNIGTSRPGLGTILFAVIVGVLLQSGM